MDERALEIRTSESVTEIAKALAEANKKMPRKVAKDAANPHFRSRYASLAALTEAVLPVYSEQEIVPLMSFSEVCGRWVLSCRLLHASGEWVESALPVPLGEGATPQQVGSAITYARRYVLGMVSGIAADDDTDDDGQAAEGASAPARPAAARSEPAPSGTWPLGKHKGKALADIPANYLEWASENLDNAAARAMAVAELERREINQEPPPEVVPFPEEADPDDLPF